MSVLWFLIEETNILSDNKCDAIMAVAPSDYTITLVGFEDN